MDRNRPGTFLMKVWFVMLVLMATFTVAALIASAAISSPHETKFTLVSHDVNGA